MACTPPRGSLFDADSPSQTSCAFFSGLGPSSAEPPCSNASYIAPLTLNASWPVTSDRSSDRLSASASFPGAHSSGQRSSPRPSSSNLSFLGPGASTGRRSDATQRAAHRRQLSFGGDEGNSCSTHGPIMCYPTMCGGGKENSVRATECDKANKWGEVGSPVRGVVTANTAWGQQRRGDVHDAASMFGGPVGDRPPFVPLNNNATSVNPEAFKDMQPTFNSSMNGYGGGLRLDHTLSYGSSSSSTIAGQQPMPSVALDIDAATQQEPLPSQQTQDTSWTSQQLYVASACSGPADGLDDSSDTSYTLAMPGGFGRPSSTEPSFTLGGQLNSGHFGFGDDSSLMLGRRSSAGHMGSTHRQDSVPRYPSTGPTGRHSSAELLRTPQLCSREAQLRTELDAVVVGINASGRKALATARGTIAEVAPRMYIGEFPRGPAALRRLRSLGVTDVVNLCCGTCPSCADTQQQFAVHNLPTLDAHDYFILDMDYGKFAAIVDGVLGDRNRALYVHCLAGVNRSCILCAAYLIDRHGHDATSAVEHLHQQGRPVLLENGSFRQQLVAFYLQCGKRSSSAGVCDGRGYAAIGTTNAVLDGSREFEYAPDGADLVD